MHICRVILFVGLAILMNGSTAFASEPKLPFDLVPDPQVSVTDIEEPAWKYASGGFITNLRLALKGNPYAMINLAITSKYYGDLTEKKYPQVPKKMHYHDFWLNWAERFTSKGWALVRFGYAHGGIGTLQRPYFIKAAKADHTEGMYLASKIGADSKNKKKWFWTAVERNYGPALVKIGWALSDDPSRGHVLGGEEIKKDPPRGHAYLRKAASVGMVEGLIFEAWNYEEGRFGYPKDLTTAYVCFLLATQRALDLDSKRHVRAYSAGFEKIAETLSPEALQLAEQTANNWIREFDAHYAATLEKARARRAPILEEFRKELAPVIEWLDGLDAAATGKAGR